MNMIDTSEDGGFVVPIPDGIDPDVFIEAFNRSCSECGAIAGTHWPKCSKETRQPIVFDLSLSDEELYRRRGIPEDMIKMAVGDKYVGVR